MTKPTRLFLFVSGGILAAGLGTGLVAAYVGGFQNLSLLAASGPEELSYLPSDAKVVAYANVRELMDSELHQKLQALTPRLPTAPRSPTQPTHPTQPTQSTHAMQPTHRRQPTQASVLMAFSAVPTASSAYVLAARMGYNGPFVAGLVTLSTTLGVLSLPFALGVLR